MNLTNTSIIIKKNTGVILFVSSVMIFTYLIINRFIDKPPVEQPQTLNYPQITSLPIQVNKFTTQDSRSEKIPNKLKVYSTTPSVDFFADTKSLQNKFGVPDNETVSEGLNKKKLVLTSNASGILSIQEEFLSYQKILTTPSNSQASFNEQEFAGKASSYLSSLGLSIELPQDYSTTYIHFEGEDYYEDKTEAGSSWVKFKYSYTTEGLKILTPTNETAVSINRSGEIMKAEIYPPKVRRTLGEYPTIQLDKAFEQLEQGKGIPVGIEGKGVLYIGDSRFRSINTGQITNTYPAYYSSATSDSEHPVWVFETQTTINNTPTTINFMVFAIDPKFYNPSTNTNSK